MRLLHTSDWHLGRSLHGHDLLAGQAAFCEHLIATARAERVDAVLLSGDVHDRALPPVEALGLFADTLARLRDAGVAVVAISGNHDAPTRLGDKAALLDRTVSIRTDPARVGEPVLLADAHGPVAVYAVPYLEPAAVRDRLPGVEGDEPGAHTRALARALRAVHADRAGRGARCVVLAHAWVTGGEASPGSERDISVGGVAQVPVALFGDVDYVALGHLHRPQAVAEQVRYSGSPLPYSFGEAAVAKGSWLVELGPAGLVGSTWVPAPVHRRLSRVRGTLADLLGSREHDGREGDFVSVVLTDLRHPLDAMSAVQRRFPHALELRWEPAGVERPTGTYAALTGGRSDLEVAEVFLTRVRGVGADSRERALLVEALESAARAESEAA